MTADAVSEYQANDKIFYTQMSFIDTHCAVRAGWLRILRSV